MFEIIANDQQPDLFGDDRLQALYLQFLAFERALKAAEGFNKHALKPEKVRLDKALDELHQADAGIYPAITDRLSSIKSALVETLQRVKAQADTIAAMQAEVDESQDQLVYALIRGDSQQVAAIHADNADRQTALQQTTALRTTTQQAVDSIVIHVKTLERMQAVIAGADRQRAALAAHAAYLPHLQAFAVAFGEIWAGEKARGIPHHYTDKELAAEILETVGLPLYVVNH